jgi:hypothetical protein
MQQYANIPIFRVTAEHYEIIKKAGEIIQRKGDAHSFSDFLRKLIITQSAHILGQPVPDLSIYHWGRKKKPAVKKPIEVVSEKTGIPVKDLKKAWLEAFAEQAAKQWIDEDTDQPVRKSDIGGLIPPASEPRAVQPIRRRK